MLLSKLEEVVQEDGYKRPEGYSTKVAINLKTKNTEYDTKININVEDVAQNKEYRATKYPGTHIEADSNANTDTTEKEQPLADSRDKSVVGVTEFPVDSTVVDIQEETSSLEMLLFSDVAKKNNKTITSTNGDKSKNSATTENFNRTAKGKSTFEPPEAVPILPTNDPELYGAGMPSCVFYIELFIVILIVHTFLYY